MLCSQCGGYEGLLKTYQLIFIRLLGYNSCSAVVDCALLNIFCGDDQIGATAVYAATQYFDGDYVVAQKN
jgi:hypothetical protein